MLISIPLQNEIFEPGERGAIDSTKSMEVIYRCQVWSLSLSKDPNEPTKIAVRSDKSVPSESKAVIRVDKIC